MLKVEKQRFSKKKYQNKQNNRINQTSEILKRKYDTVCFATLYITVEKTAQNIKLIPSIVSQCKKH